MPIGIVLGLCLGLALFVAWDRYDPRADDARAVEAQFGIPVTALGPRSYDGALRAVLERWRSLASSDRSATVALVAATAQSAEAAGTVSKRLASVKIEAETLIEAGPPGGPAGGELIAVEASLVVLVVAAGERLVEARRTFQTLDELGAAPRWAIFASRE